MVTSVARRREAETGKDDSGSSRFFYLTISGVFVIGFSFNAWTKYAAEVPTLNTFLDLLTIRKTEFCSNDGTVLTLPPPQSTPNCLDYRGYRIVEGDSVIIYEIAAHDPNPFTPARFTRVAELKTDALKRLFNLKFEDRPSNPPKGFPW